MEIYWKQGALTESGAFDFLDFRGKEMNEIFWPDLNVSEVDIINELGCL